MHKKFHFKDFLLQNNTYFIFLILIVICSVLSDSFLSVMNIKNIALQQAGSCLYRFRYAVCDLYRRN